MSNTTAPKTHWRQGMILLLLMLAGTHVSLASQVKVENYGPGGGGTPGCLAFEKDNPKVAYIGLDCGGMHVTRDGGKTWKNANRGIVYDGHVNFNNHNGVVALGNGVALCATRTGKIYRTENYGENWEQVFANHPKGPGVSIGFMLQSPHDPSVLYAAVGRGVHGGRGVPRRLDRWDGKIYISRQAGRKGTWSHLNTDPTNKIPSNAHITTLAVDGINPDLMYATTNKGIYRSRDGGVSWFSIQGSLGDGVPVQIVSPQGVPNTVYVTIGYWKKTTSKVRAGVYKSTDAGETWKAVCKGLPASQKRYFALASDPRNPEVLYVGTWSWRGSLYRTLNGGKTWEVVLDRELASQNKANRIWHSDQYHVSVGTSLAVGGPDTDGDGRSDAIWFTGDNVGINWNSTDGGATWRQVTTHTQGDAMASNGQMQLMCVRRIVFNPKDASNLFVADYDWGIFESKDRARTWKMIGGPHYDGELCGSGRSIVFDPDDQTTIYSAIGHGYKGHGGIVRRLPSGRFHLFAGQKKQRRGLPNAAINSLAIVYVGHGQARQKYLYASSGAYGVFRINLDKPKSLFEKVNRGLVREKSLQTLDMKHVKVGPGARLYLSTLDGIYRSDDGRSWKKLTGPGTAFPVLTAIREFAVDPAKPDRVYAAQMDTWRPSKSQGLYVSDDAGETWTLAAPIIMPFGLAKEPGDSVLVATQAHGVIRVSWDKAESRWRSEPFANASNGLSILRCWTVTVAPDDSGRVYIGTHGGFVYEAVESR